MLPLPVLDYVHTLIIKSRSPAYLLVGKDGNLIDWGGKLSLYGIAGLQKGEPIGKQVPFLDGLLPLDDAALFLPRVKPESGISSDIHIFPGDEGDWILLLDVTSDEMQGLLLQQKGNELSLLRHKVSKVLDQRFGKSVIEELPQEILSLGGGGVRRDITVLSVEIRGSISYSAENPPEVVLTTLNQYLRTVIQPVLDEAGILLQVLGDAIMTIFGVLPAIASPSTEAIKAALRILDNVKELNKVREMDDRSTFDIGIGIASGPVVLGMLGSRGRSTFSAIGSPVNLAKSLEQQAKRGEVLIDENTFRRSLSLQDGFSGTTVRLRGIDEPLQVFLCEVNGYE